MKLVLLICSVALAAFLMGNPAQADEEVLTVARWTRQLQAIGAKYQKGATEPQTAVARKQLIEDLADFREVKVHLNALIRDVRWRDGIAEIFMTSFIPANLQQTSRVRPLTLSWTMPIELNISQEEAAAIKLGSRVEFEGTLQFHPHKYAAIGRTVGAQQTHTVYYKGLGGLALGTYTSPDCVITINRQVYPSRWAQELKGTASE